MLSQCQNYAREIALKPQLVRHWEEMSKAQFFLAWAFAGCVITFLCFEA